MSFIAAIFAIIFIVIVIYFAIVTSKDDFENVYTSGAYQNQKINQPLAFKKQKLATSGCTPWTGCLYPLPNPINVSRNQNGDRVKEPYVKTCKKSWRDCSAYSYCNNGQCKPKLGIYSGF